MGYDTMQIDICRYYTFDCLEDGSIKFLQDIGTHVSVHLPSYVCEDCNIHQHYCENITYCRTCLVRVCLWGRQSETVYIFQKSSDAHCCQLRCMLIFYVICIFSDLGMLEDGMTSRDKQNLWAVIKISQDTAKAEEEGRQEQARQALQFDQVTHPTPF